MGTPIALGSSLMVGLTAFFVEPAKAHNAEEFLRGLATGTAILAKNSLFGLLTMISQLAGGMGKGLAVLSMDEDYIHRFRSRPMSYRERLLSGLQSFGIGIYEGVIGAYCIRRFKFRGSLVI